MKSLELELAKEKLKRRAIPAVIALFFTVSLFYGIYSKGFDRYEDTLDLISNLVLAPIVHFAIGYFILLIIGYCIRYSGIILGVIIGFALLLGFLGIVDHSQKEGGFLQYILYIVFIPFIIDIVRVVFIIKNIKRANAQALNDDKEWQIYGQSVSYQGFNEELRYHLDESNRINQLCRNNFDMIIELIKDKGDNPERYQELIVEYKDIMNIYAAISQKLSSGQVLQSEVPVICNSLSDCCMKLRILFNKQNTYIEELKQMKDQRFSHQKTDTRQDINSSFFVGCTDLDSLTKRYRDLCKVYHPDMGNGSQEIFAQINNEYESLKNSMH